MAKAPASVEFRAVTKAYGPVVAVDSVSFTIPAANLVTLLGPSGCGKTTCLRMIAGLEMATSGAIFIGGRDVTHLSAADRDVSMVFQSYALFPHMSVLDNAAYGPSVQGATKAAARELAMTKLKMLGLDGMENRLPSELSGGQQQRVAIARALVLEPQVLLFDEPLSNLDAKLRRRVREEIRDLQRKLNLTVAYVTHDQEEALAVSDQVIVMSNARIAQVGTPRELYEEPASLFVADFVGDSNLLDVEVIRVEADTVTVRLGALDLALPRGKGLVTGAGKLMVRPNSVRLFHKPGARTLASRIAKAAYIGKHMEYSIETPAGEVFVIDGVRADSWKIGDDVHVEFDDHIVKVLQN